jgi:hypothetical protein
MQKAWLCGLQKGKDAMELQNEALVEQNETLRGANASWLDLYEQQMSESAQAALQTSSKQSELERELKDAKAQIKKQRNEQIELEKKESQRILELSILNTDNEKSQTAIIDLPLAKQQLGDDV